jgi:LysM repeat protein
MALGAMIVVVLSGGVAAAATIEPHSVAARESLSTIAQKYQVLASDGAGDWRRLCDANPEVKNPNVIFAGQQIRIPDAGEEVAHRAECELPVPVAAAPVVVRRSESQTTSTPRRSTASGQPVAQPQANHANGAGGVLAKIRHGESSGDYGAVSPSGQYRGAYQFDLPTWQSVGGSGDPASASPVEQDARAQMLYEQRGCNPWPNTC